MNGLGTILLWCALQVTALTLVVAALYVVTRRLNSPLAALVPFPALALVILLSLIAISPWPRWSSLLSGAEEALGAFSNWDAADSIATGPQREPLAVPLETGPSEAAELGESSSRLLSIAVSDFPPDESQPDAPSAAGEASDRASSSWLEWVTMIVLGAIALGCVRLVGGLWAVNRFYRRSDGIRDIRLRSSLDALQARMGCRRKVDLCEATSLTAPATFGWRRPVILLPTSWREWTLVQQQAVLAHELAHVHRHDFAAWTVAQLATVVHFYHPVVHWLASRLRLEQELAADAVAAECAGGREAYLQSLAALALREADRPIAWPARPFLPSRGTLLRRIEMLRNPNRNSERTHWWKRGALYAVLLLIVGATAGLRGQAESAHSVATQTDREQSADPTGIEPLVTEQPEGNADDVVAAPETAATGTLSVTIRLTEKPPELPPLVNQGANVKDAQVCAAEDIPNESLVVGDKLGVANVFVYLEQAPAGSTFEPATDEAVLDTLGCRFVPHAQVVRAGQPVKVANSDPIRTNVHTFPRRNRPFNHVLHAKDRDGGSMEFNKPEKTPVGVKCDFHSWKQAWVLPLAHPFGGVTDQDGNVTISGLPPGKHQFQIWHERMGAQPMVVGATIEAGQTVEMPLAFPAATFLTAAEKTNRAPGVRWQFENPTKPTRDRLKGLGLALHEYHNIFRQFPRPVVLGPDSKTPHSWRIELLPLVVKELREKLTLSARSNASALREEYNALIESFDYRLNEPWNSEHNRKLLAKMPRDYRSPSDEPGSTHSGCFVLTGNETMFSEGTDTRVRDVADGSANTIALVEARRDIPWTKPEDIPYSTAEPLPTLGGWHAGGFHVVFADGSVYFLKDGIGENVLRSLITKDGGEPNARISVIRRHFEDGQRLFKDSKMREADAALQLGMVELAGQLRWRPELADEQDVVSIAMMGMLYWRYCLQLRGLPVPDEYPLQELWEAHQDELPQFVSQFRADNGL